MHVKPADAAVVAFDRFAGRAAATRFRWLVVDQVTAWDDMGFSGHRGPTSAARSGGAHHTR